MDTELASVRASSPVSRAAAVAVGLVGLAALWRVTVMSIRHRSVGYGLFTFGMVLVVLVGGSLRFLRTYLFGGQWTVDSRITAPNGQKYCFLDANAFRDSTMALGKARSWNPLYTTYDVLVTGEWHHWASIIRPAGAGEDYNRLYVNDEGLIIGIHADDHGVFAYDTQAGRSYDRHAAKELSPFVLIGPDTEMHQPDVSALVDRMNNHLYLSRRGWSGYPLSSTLATARADHPNPAVRELAQQLLDIVRAQLERRRPSNSASSRRRDATRPGCTRLRRKGQMPNATTAVIRHLSFSICHSAFRR